MIAHSRRFRKRPSKFPKIFFALMLLALLGFLAVSNWKIHKKRTELNSGVEVLTKKLQELESVNQELKAKISDIPDQNYLEKVAREKFNLKKPGEEVVVIKKQTETPSSDKTGEKKSFLNPQNWFEPVRNTLRSWLRLDK